MIEPHALSSFSEQKILVAGVARDCEKTVRDEVLRLFESLKMCKALHWLVIESDSSDKTVDALRVLEKEVPGFRFRSLGSLRQGMPVRTQRIAHCRNVYLEELRSNPLYSEIDFVVVADLDGVNNLVTTEGIASCWTRSDWGVCTANQRGPYYDIWALRHSLWSPDDCWQQYEFLLSKRAHREVALWTAMYAKMITIGEREDWIEVESAFGGLAVYRKHALDDIAYSGLDETGRPVCEHVALNSRIRSKGFKIFLNPQMINTAQTVQAHQRELPECLRRLFRDLRSRIKKRALNVLRQN
jgi:hypothetical protein